MSNFAFMDNPRFLKDPACALMRKGACLAELNFHSNREVCALYARRTLEVFCPFISSLKGAKYPEPPKYRERNVGDYWIGRNEAIFTGIVGYPIYRRIRTINCTANSYVHVHGPVREDYYPEILKNLYEVLLWLYKEQLGLETTWKSGDYRASRVSAGGAPETVWDDKDFERTPERTLKQLKKAFPNCNTQSLCSVELEGDHYVIRDLHGAAVGELPAPEALEHSQEEVQRLRTRMDGVQREYEQLQEELGQLIEDKDERICLLGEQVAQADRHHLELTANQKRETDALRKEIERLKNAKGDIESTYREKLQLLGQRYDDLDHKYQALLPVEEQRNELRRQVEKQMERQAALERKFSQKQDAMLSEIADSRRHLAEAQKRIQRMSGSEAASQALISRLQRELDAAEAELRSTQEEVRRNAQQHQKDMEDLLRRQSGRPGGLAAAETAVIKGNARLRDKMSAFERGNQAGAYLQIVNQGLEEIDKGMIVYNGDAQQLRRFFKQVKRHYERQIDDLKAQLAQKEREQAEERRRYQKMSGAVTMEPSAPSGKRGKGRFALALCLLLLLGLSGYTAVNQWRLGSALSGILARGEEQIPEPKDSGTAPPSETENGGDPEPLSPEGAAKPEENAPEAPEGGDPVLPPEDASESAGSFEGEKHDLRPDGAVTSAEEAEAALNALREAYEASLPLEDIRDVPGIGTKLLDELEDYYQNFRKGDLRKDVQNGDAETLGELTLPGIHFHTYDGKPDVMNDEMEYPCDAVRLLNYEEIRFSYLYTYMYRTDIWYAAAEISSLHSQLDRGSTLEEVTEALRAQTAARRTLAQPTALTDAETEYCVVFQYQTGYPRVFLVCFNENDQVCDYVYFW